MREATGTRCHRMSAPYLRPMAPIKRPLQPPISPPRPKRKGSVASKRETRIKTPCRGANKSTPHARPLQNRWAAITSIQNVRKRMRVPNHHCRMRVSLSSPGKSLLNRPDSDRPWTWPRSRVWSVHRGFARTENTESARHHLSNDAVGNRCTPTAATATESR